MNQVNIINPSTKAIEQYFRTKHHVLQFENINTHDKNTEDADGIVSYEIVNNKVYQLYKSYHCQQYQFSNEISFRLHKEDDVVRKEVYTIPLDITYVKKEIRKYKLHSNSLLTLILENSIHSNDNNTKKISFEVNENEITESIKEEMITFLSLLKLYK